MMIGGMIIFILGIVFGGCAVIVNQRMVELQNEKLKRENTKLREKIHVDRVEYERDKAYRRGYYNGIHKDAGKDRAKE